MSNFVVLIVLEVALVIACSLVLYCVYSMNNLKETNIKHAGKIAEDDEKIDDLQRNLNLSASSTATLIRTEEAFAAYRQKTKLMMQKLKASDGEKSRLAGMLKKRNAENARLMAQYKRLLQQTQEETPVTKSSDNPVVKPSAHIDENHLQELQKRTSQLQNKAKQLEERLEQTLIEKDFIEKKFVEIAILESDVAQGNEELQRTKKELQMLESHITFQAPERAVFAVQ